MIDRSGRVILAVLVACGVLQASAQDTAPTTDELIEVLRSSNASIYDKAMACRQLAVHGDESAAAALAELVPDSRLSSYARHALEQTPGEAADDALISLAGELEGSLLVGVLDSLGRRQNPRSLEILTSQLDSPDDAIVEAAARGLERIGGESAFSALREALGEASGRPRDVIAYAILDSADSIASDGDPAGQLDAFDLIWASEASSHVRLAAAQRIVVAGGDRGLVMLATLLGSDERGFQAGVQAALERGPDSVDMVLTAFDDLPADRQVVAVPLLAALNPVESLPTLLGAASSDEPALQVAAFRALPASLPAEALESLWTGLLDSDEEVSAAAFEALDRVESEEVDQGIVQLLDSAEHRERLLAIRLIESRRIESGSSRLQELASSANVEIRAASLRAWAAVLTLSQLPALVKRFNESEGERRAEVRVAISLACARLPREPCAEALVGGMRDQPVETQIALLEELTAIGGEKALEAVAGAARSGEEALQDAGTRLLGTWPTSDVAPVLEELAGTIEPENFRIRALRGYIRVARQLEMTTEQRTEMCGKALDLAERDAERLLAIDVLIRFPTVNGLRLAVDQLAEDGTRDAARDAVRGIAEATAQDHGQLTAELLNLAMKADPALADESETGLAGLMNQARELARSQESAEGFVPLFDGKSLDGWHGNEEWFRIEEESIVAGSLERPIERNEFLRTDELFGDFELRLQFKLVGASPNAGVQIRTQEIPDHHEVSGYQADLGPGWWGCLYDESRRNRVLAGPPADQRGGPVREDQWNDYRIVCEGSRIQLFVNGVQTVDFVEEDEEIPLTGIIAVQVHSGEPMEAWYREIRLRPFLN